MGRTHILLHHSVDEPLYTLDGFCEIIDQAVCNQDLSVVHPKTIILLSSLQHNNKYGLHKKQTMTRLALLIQSFLFLVFTLLLSITLAYSFTQQWLVIPYAHDNEGFNQWAFSV